MKRVILTVLGLCSFLCSESQTLKVKSVEELANDISARTMSRVDENNNPCAILRINAPTIENLQFGESVVGDVKYLPGEYIAYIKPDASTLSYSYKGENTTVSFSNYGIKIEGKKSYRIILENESANRASQSTQAYITANYDNVIVLVDGVPVGETPVLVESIAPGRHTISIPNTIGFTMPDTIVEIAENEKNTITLNLHQEKREPVYVKYYQPGGDTAGWYFIFGIITVHDGDKVGLVDYTGEKLIPTIYDDIVLEKILDYYMVGVKDAVNKWRWGLYAPGKGLVKPCVYDNFYYYKFKNGKSYIKFQKDKKWGLYDAALNEILPIAFDGIDCRDKVIVRSRENGNDRVSMYDYNGRLLIKPLQSISHYNEGYCLFYDYDMAGVLTLDGKKTYLPSKYSLGSIYNLCDYNIVSSGLFKVRDKETDKWGYMDTNLNMVFPAIFDGRYDGPDNFVMGVVNVSLDGNEVVLDNKGNIIIDSQKQGLSRIDILSDDGSWVDFEWYHKWKNLANTEDNYDYEGVVIKVHDNQSKQGIYDVAGRIVVPCGIYDDINFYKYKNEVYYICIKKTGLCDIFDSEGNVIRTLQMDGYTSMRAYVHNDDICFVREKGTDQLQFLDGDFNILTTLPKGFVINHYKDGIFQITDGEPEDTYRKGVLVYLDTSYGYINIKGKMIANCVYGYGGVDSNFNEDDNGDDGEEGGKYDAIAALIYENPISDGLALLAIGDRYGYVDIEGNVVAPLIYKAVTPFEDGVAYALRTDDKWIKIYRKDL